MNTTPSTATKPLKLLNNSSNDTHNNNKTSQTLSHNHLDYVLSMSFDYYGRRFATSSGDRTVRVWNLNNNDGMWSSQGVFTAARGPVQSLSWAHPAFGQLIATAGADHSVVVWEEREGGFKSLATPERSADGFLDTTTTQQVSGENNNNTSRWASKATLSDARRAVTCVEFSPRHLGLRLASGSADGIVRIYEALDTMNLNHWKLEAEIEPDNDGGVGGSSSNTSPDGNSSSSNENMGVSSLSWCTGRFEPATLVVGLSSGRVSIYRYNDTQRSWNCIRLPGHADPSSGVPRGALDVAWAPNVGRSFHLIASCGKDNQLKVHRVKRSSSGLTYESTELLDQSQAWRVSWNVTGTVLAASGDGGIVKLFKSDFHGKWKCVSQIVGDSSGVAAASALQNQ